MKNTFHFGLLSIMLLVGSARAHANGTTESIQFKPGEMKLMPFVQMISEQLDLQVDASGLEGTDADTVTVPDTGPVSVDRAKAVALTSLYLAGYTWIHDTSTDFYRILRLRDARDQEIPFLTDSDPLPDNDLLVSQIISLEHASAEGVARTIRAFMPANARVIPSEAAHSVMITDAARNIAKLRKIVQQLDTPEIAKQAKDALAARASRMENACPPMPGALPGPKPGLMIALFSLMALVIGFLSRGYVIRRIEGGL